MRTFIALAFILVPTTAVAGPGLTLPHGKINLALTAEAELSTGATGKPLSLAPDASYGVTDDLTVAVVHSKFAMTGFRASAGGGLCVAGTDGGCVNAYNNVGAEAWYALGRGRVALAAGGGAHATNLDAGFYAAKLGVKSRYGAGNVAVTAMPAILIAMTEREDAAGARLNKDTLWVPVMTTYRAGALTVGAGTGLKGPLSGFGDAWQVPLGFLGQYTVDPALSIGTSLVFGQVLGGADATGFDYRGGQLWVSYTR